MANNDYYNQYINPLIALRVNPQFITQNIDMLAQSLESITQSEVGEIIDFYADIRQNLNKEDKKRLYDIIISRTKYSSYDQIDSDIDYYKYYSQIFSQYNQHAKHYDLDELAQLLQNESQPLETITPYVLSHYIKYYKCKKSTFFANQKQGYDVREIVLAYFKNDRILLAEKLHELIEQRNKVIFEAKEKKISKIIQKANTKLNNLKKDNLNENEIEYEIQCLKKEVTDRVTQHVTPENYHLFPIIETFLNDCQVTPNNLMTNQEKAEEKKVEIEEKKLILIETIFNTHHIYFKKTAILNELMQAPELYQLFLFYSKICEENNADIQLEKLQELISDINDTGKKNTECCRRLLSIINKQIEEIYNKEAISEEIIEEEEIIKEETNLGPTITIGKNVVYINTEKRNPTNIEKLTELLHPESKGRIRYLERLIFEIGYDKVHAYLTKAPHIYIEDLDAIIRTDRQLRFEFQRILEDIEMYFRSSLTYYLTNKYDKVYQSPNNKLFYKRGYLQKALFMDGDEHYRHIGQLNDRIDQELNNNNQQVVTEFQHYKYALPFSTSAGIMPFGWLTSIFDNLNYNDRVEYLSTYYYMITPQTFSNWMNSLASLRNRCAHYQSLYRLSSLKELKPIMTKDIDGNAFDDDFKHSTLFYYTIVMTRLSPDVFNIEDFIDNLGVIFRKASRENYAFDLFVDYSFPKTWRQILENEKNSKIKMLID